MDASIRNASTRAVLITQISAPEHIEQARRLFLEYAQSLGFSLCFQNFDQELKTLPGAYHPPSGRLLIALDSDTAAGCVALRKLGDGICEMKRLYVRPAYRGSGLGKLLVNRAIAEARAIGYGRMRLDTVASSMQAAIALYRRLGFREIPAYCPNPMAEALYMELTVENEPDEDSPGGACMHATNAPDLRYPVGKFERPTAPLTPDQRREFIDAIAEVPARLREALRGLSPAQFDTPYRAGGWTVRQVVHHLADSHMNSYVRFKLALTEDEPTIKTYEENLWAQLPDSRDTPIEVSLALLENLHKRWVILLRSLKPADFARTFRHPEWGRDTVDFLLAQYAGHGRHHVAHITTLRNRNGWR